MTSPFDYPTAPMVRRHEPRGYANAASFRPWLRDDFSFRCVFCGIRETWQPTHLDVEHFEPVARVPARVLDYRNLLYACRTCNAKKGDRTVPDPTAELLGGVVTMDDTGLLAATTPAARELILVLALNTRRQRAFRRMLAEVVRMAAVHSPAVFHQLMGYPDDLPNLSRLRPPGGNGKPEGIADSHHARRGRGELPETC
jgi:hypothetical protein